METALHLPEPVHFLARIWPFKTQVPATGSCASVGDACKTARPVGMAKKRSIRRGMVGYLANQLSYALRAVAFKPCTAPREVRGHDGRTRAHSRAAARICYRRGAAPAGSFRSCGFAPRTRSSDHVSTLPHLA